MKRILIVPVACLLLPYAAWAVCCSSITAGPTCPKPEFSHTGCGALYKISYGGNCNVTTDNSALYQTSALIVCTAEMVPPPGFPGGIIAKKSNNVGLNCGNVTTGIGFWTTTLNCPVRSGTQVDGRCTVTTTACPTAPAVTKEATSDIATAP